MSTVNVRVPASSANLGGGFDCVGVAIDRWLAVEASLAGEWSDTTVDRRGTLRALDLDAAEDRLVQGYHAAAVAAGIAHPPAVHLRANSEIPIGRGLGSSAAATVAGALAANQLLSLGLDEHALLDVAGAVEGHADNAAPALFGGATLVTAVRGAQDVVRGKAHASGCLVRALELHPEIALVFAVPDFGIETRAARAVLPEFVPHRTASGAAARAAALVQGLTRGDVGLLGVGLDDVLHVPFRRRLVKGYAAVTAAARSAGAAGATLSGSGSAIVAIALNADVAAAAGEAMRAAWAECGVAATTIQPSIVREFACR